MAISIVGFNRSYVAGVDLSSNQYLFVKMSGATIVPCTAAMDTAIGVLQNKPLLGQAGTVAITGVVKAIAAVAITAGDILYIDASGKATNVTVNVVIAKNVLTSGSFSLTTGVVTVCVTAHGFAAGDVVTIASATTAGNNGTFVVQSVSTNAFTISNANGKTEDVATPATATKVIRAQRVVGIAETAASGAGVNVSVLLRPLGAL